VVSLKPLRQNQNLLMGCHVATSDQRRPRLMVTVWWPTDRLAPPENTKTHHRTGCCRRRPPGPYRRKEPDGPRMCRSPVDGLRPPQAGRFDSRCACEATRDPQSPAAHHRKRYSPLAPGTADSPGDDNVRRRRQTESPSARADPSSSTTTVPLPRRRHAAARTSLSAARLHARRHQTTMTNRLRQQSKALRVG